MLFSCSGHLLKRKSHRSTRRSQGPGRLGLEALEDRLTPSTFTVVNTADSGPGSLRQAILDANANGNPGEVDLIQFNQNQLFSGSAFTIKLASPLPALTESVVIDGYTQKPAHPNASAQANDAGIVIELDGSAAGPNADGITLEADNSIVRGLAINGFSGAGVVVRGGNDVVAGNFIGTDATGTTARGNGVGVLVAGSNDRVGTGDLADQNLISGNARGVVVDGATAARIQGNRIGTDVSGNQGLGNTEVGVDVVAGTQTLIGGSGSHEGNVISANGLLTLGSGVVISAPTTTVQGNDIGLPSDLAANQLGLGNGLDGIRVQAGDVLIGGPDSGEANRIAFNGHNGVTVVGDVGGVRVFDNIITLNGGLSIDLGDDGPTANDPGDADTGPNGLQNSPVLSSAILTPQVLVIDGTLNSKPNTLYRIEFFAAVAPGAGTVVSFLGFSTVQTDSQGNASFRFVEPAVSGVTDGLLLTATATAPDGSTSEFSPTIAGGADKADLVVTVADNVSSVTAGGSVTYVITVTNSGPDAVFGATLKDVLPAALTNVAFTSVAANGALGNTLSGKGVITDTLTLPPGGTVVYTVTATLPADAQGVLTVTAVASDPTGVIDPTPANNTATDTDTITGGSVTPANPLTGNERFVDQVFRDLLGRPADANGLKGFSDLLAGGATRTQVVSLIQSGTEFRLRALDDLYTRLLHRQPDAPGEQGFLSFLSQGGSLEQVETAILSSDEYFRVRGGGTSVGFLGAVYQDVLGRAPDAPGLQGFTEFLAHGGSRSSAAFSIQTSPEADVREVTGLYQQFLRRNPDDCGLAGFVAALENGVSEQQAEALILGSEEYLLRFAS